ncbi:RNA helicase, partial [Vibrio vulnificus BAA87]
MENYKPLIERLVTDSLNSECFIRLYSELASSYAGNKIGIHRQISINDTDSLCRYADILSLSNNAEHRVLSYRIIVRLLSVSEIKEDLGSLARSIFTKLGLFVSESKFEKKLNAMPPEKELVRLSKKIRQKSPFGEEILTDSQFEIFSALLEKDCFSFSGPTSFGKSFLIRNYVYKCVSENKNVVVLVPTKALIEEYLRDIRLKLNELNIENINVSKTAAIYSLEKINVMILTPERFNSLIYSQNELLVDVLIVDEAHKLGDDDERSITAFKVIQQAINLYPQCKLIFSSPVINNPSIFLSSFGLKTENARKVKEGPVTQNLYFVDIVNKTCNVYNELTDKFDTVTDELAYSDKFEFIKKISLNVDSNLIYCSSKSGSVENAVEFSKDLEYKDSIALINASNNIKELIHDDYYLSDLVKKGVAFHNADLPKVIRNIIEELYQERHIKYIFCTSTLLEGVNLPTGNLFLYSFSDKKKITNKTKLDFWNLAGRAGRYTKELDGNIYCIRETVTNWSKINDLVSEKDSVLANTTALKKLERGQKIINILEKGKLDESKQERIMEQIVNIILSEFLENKSSSDSSRVIGLIPKKFHRRITALLDKKFDELNLGIVPSKLLASGHNIPLERHLDVINDVSESPHIIKSLSNNEIYNAIHKICSVYKLKYSDKQVNRLYRIAQNWITGLSLKNIISNTIIDHKENNRSVMIERGIFETFNEKNIKHVNKLINDVISTIEGDIGYTR